MNAVTTTAGNAIDSPIRGSLPEQNKFDNTTADPSDGAHFRAALERHMQAASPATRNDNNKISLSEKLMGRASDLASEIKKDQQYVSRTLEQATRSGDSMQLMKAMMALNDYQMRVQFISKTASKATSSIDQLTKLQ